MSIGGRIEAKQNGGLLMIRYALRTRRGGPELRLNHRFAAYPRSQHDPHMALGAAPGRSHGPLAAQGKSAALQARFKTLAETLTANEAKINAELIAAQGKPVDIGGYYLPDPVEASAAMRPSATLNAAIAAL